MSQLCALSDVKTYLGTTTTNTDAALTALITSVSATIENFCNRTFAQADYTDTYNGTGKSALYLREGPITAVSSVTVDGLAIPAAASSTSYGYVFDDSMLYIRAGGTCERFNKGVQNVTVTYTAGYAAIPQDVNQACVEWVAFKFAKRARIDEKSQTLGTQQTQSYDLSDMPQSVKSALMSYIRFTP